jgi:hypothetical protein
MQPLKPDRLLIPSSALKNERDEPVSTDQVFCLSSLNTFINKCMQYQGNFASTSAKQCHGSLC